MFEPACRGGSKRSLNISNPTPKWPRSPGEMVSAPARAADTHAHTRTSTHTHAHSHPRTRGWPPRPPPSRRDPNHHCDSAIFFFFFKFQFAFAGLPHPQPPCPEESKHFSRQDLSGVVGSSCGEERGLAGLAPASRLSPGADPGTLRTAAGARVPCGARVRTEAVGACLRGDPRAPRPASEARPGLRRPGPAACGKEVYFVLRAELRTWRGAPCAALTLFPSAPTPPGPAPRNGVPLGVRSSKKMGTCIGATVLDTRG